MIKSVYKNIPLEEDLYYLVVINFDMKSFKPGPEPVAAEISRIFLNLAQRFYTPDGYSHKITIRDINGHIIGFSCFEKGGRKARDCGDPSFFMCFTCNTDAFDTKLTNRYEISRIFSDIANNFKKYPMEEPFDEVLDYYNQKIGDVYYHPDLKNLLFPDDPGLELEAIG